MFLFLIALWADSFQVAKDVDAETRRYASIALCNLAMHPNTQVQVVVHGGLGPILKMLQEDDIDSQRHALMALANIVSNEDNHQAVIGGWEWRGGVLIVVGIDDDE